MCWFVLFSFHFYCFFLSLHGTELEITRVHLFCVRISRWFSGWNFCPEYYNTKMSLFWRNLVLVVDNTWMSFVCESCVRTKLTFAFCMRAFIMYLPTHLASRIRKLCSSGVWVRVKAPTTDPPTENKSRLGCKISLHIFALRIFQGILFCLLLKMKIPSANETFLCVC